jgi:hypothetical protein
VNKNYFPESPRSIPSSSLSRPPPTLRKIQEEKQERKPTPVIIPESPLVIKKRENARNKQVRQQKQEVRDVSQSTQEQLSMELM